MSPRDKDTSVTILKVDKNRFYVLRIGKDNWIFASEDDVMENFTDKIKLNKDIIDENIQLIKVQIFKRNWKIQEVPWFKALIHTIRSNEIGATD